MAAIDRMRNRMNPTPEMRRVGSLCPPQSKRVGTGCTPYRCSRKIVGAALAACEGDANQSQLKPLLIQRERYEPDCCDT